MNNHIPQQVFEFLKSSSPFDQIDADFLQALCRRITVIYLNRDNSVTLLAELQPALFLISSGEFTVVDSIANNSSATRHLSCGDYFGYSALLDREEHQLSVDSEDPGLVYAIKSTDFDRCCDINPAFREFFRRSHRHELHRRHQDDDSFGDSESMWLHDSLKQYCNKPPLSISGDASIHAAAQKMSEYKISSLLIVEDNDLKGMITDRDLRHRVLAQGLSPLQPVATIMTAPAISITRDASVFDALLLMSRHNIHHLPIVNHHQNIVSHCQNMDMPHNSTAKNTIITQAVGFLSDSDLIRQQQGSLLFLIGSLNKAKNLTALVKTSKQAPDYLARHATRLGDYDIASHFLAQSSDLITAKLADFYRKKHGPSPCQFAWVSYGSQARREQLPSSDQDNGLLLERELDTKEAQYFANFSHYINQGLAQCGQILCPGNTMASNPELRITAKQAIDESRYWVDNPTPEALMRISIYLDMRLVLGDQNLFSQVARARQAQVKSPIFLAGLAREAQQYRPPLSLFQRFQFDNNNPNNREGHSYKDGINLKSGAINIINSIVRLYAFSEGIKATSTLDRLETLTDNCGLVEADRHNLRDIWLLLQRLRWRHQLEHGLYNSAIRLSDLSSIEQHQLKAAFRAIRQTQEALLMKFSPGSTL